ASSATTSSSTCEKSGSIAAEYRDVIARHEQVRWGESLRVHTEDTSGVDARGVELVAGRGVAAERDEVRAAEAEEHVDHLRVADVHGAGDDAGDVHLDGLRGHRVAAEVVGRVAHRDDAAFEGLERERGR